MADKKAKEEGEMAKKEAEEKAKFTKEIKQKYFEYFAEEKGET
jgi:hypothetical protein